MSLVTVHTTVASADEARSIARALIEGGLAACAHIDEVESLYHWDGALHDEREFRLALKTRAALYPAVEEAIRALHRYALPDIHAVPIAQVSAAYAAWVESRCSAADA